MREPATNRQKTFMRKSGIKFENDITKYKASVLIKKLYAKYTITQKIRTENASGGNKIAIVFGNFR